MFDGRSLYFPSFVKGGGGNLDLMISQRALLFERVEKAVATRATAAIDLGSEWMKGAQNRKDPKRKKIQRFQNDSWERRERANIYVVKGHLLFGRVKVKRPFTFDDVKSPPIESTKPKSRVKIIRHQPAIFLFFRTDPQPPDKFQTLLI
jgi:hypothetical protein